MTAYTIWFTGLPSSGKTTLAKKLNEYLNCIWLDGDNFRQHISSDLGFSKKDRIINLKRVIGCCKILNAQQFNVITSFISPSNYINELVKKELNAIIVYLNTPIDICIARDVKGLYKKALAGEIKDFTGINSEYLVPTVADLILDTNKKKKDECVKCILVVLTEKFLI